MSERRPRVLVMMATYNGERYLREQIDSVLAQEGVDVGLVIRDDCSTDGTWDICQEYKKACANVSATRSLTNIGSRRNFLTLLSEISTDGFDYFAYADQDDIWLPDKLHVAAELLSELPLARPGLYCTPTFNCDAELNPLGYQPFDPSWGQARYRYSQVITLGAISGCTMVFNTSLLSVLRRYPLATTERWHDELATICACLFGTLIQDEESHIRRRLHEGNVSGRRPGLRTRFETRWRLIQRRGSYSQTARELLDAFPDLLTAADREKLDEVASYKRSLAARLLLLRDRDICGVSRQNDIYYRFRVLAGLV